VSTHGVGGERYPHGRPVVGERDGVVCFEITDLSFAHPDKVEPEGIGDAGTTLHADPGDDVYQGSRVRKRDAEVVGGHID
jgi:hypothetical protein